jgi:ubiquinol-cytochrome c reductase cytochrome c subunit
MFAAVLAAIVSAQSVGAAANESGQALYRQDCASCHGVDLRGGDAAPSLLHVGAADVDFWVSTGRMPAAVPWLQVGHRGLQAYITPVDEARIVTYVASASSGGPAIPIVTADGDADRGQTLFRENCEHCHGVDAGGAAIGSQNWAPSLGHATVTQVAEAIRVGPGQMPQFGERQLDARDVDDIVTYLSSRRGVANFSGLPIDAGGAVPEGMYGWIAAGILALFAFGYWSIDRSTESQKETPDVS